MGYRVNIAAAKKDWLDLFTQADREHHLIFYPTIGFSLDEIAPIGIEEIPNLGYAKHGILVLENSYLAVPKTIDVAHREIQQDNGSVRYAVDQLVNFDSFVFRPGGLWKDKYIIGEISSLYNTGISADTARKIKSCIKKLFHRHIDYWVGTECNSLFSNYSFTVDYRY